MGDRAQLAVIDGDGPARVYLYTHWHGTELPETLKAALIRGKSRWDDSSYLTRIIFNEMTKGNEMGETGFGIDCTLHGDVFKPVPVLDCNTQMITWENVKGEPREPISFADFIK
jgi:hypothetical protein